MHYTHLLSLLHYYLVCGAILGTQTSRAVEVLNSFELVFSARDGQIELDAAYFKQKADQFKEVFKSLDVLVRCEASLLCFAWPFFFFTECIFLYFIYE